MKRPKAIDWRREEIDRITVQGKRRNGIRENFGNFQSKQFDGTFSDDIQCKKSAHNFNIFAHLNNIEFIRAWIQRYDDAMRLGVSRNMDRFEITIGQSYRSAKLRIRKIRKYRPSS